MIFFEMFGFNNSSAADAIASIGGVKTCIKNGITDTELASALQAYYGNIGLWNKLFVQFPATAGFYISEIRVMC